MTVAFVTGATGAIGAGVCRVLASEGQQVAVGYRGDESRATLIVESIERAGGEAIPVRCDITDRAGIEVALARVGDVWGPPQVVVTAAAIGSAKVIAELTPAAWTEAIAVNLGGTFGVIRATLPAMLEARWGRIVTIGSPLASHLRPGRAAYAATKSAVAILTRVVAMEVARRGVTANMVVPGRVDSPVHRALELESEPTERVVTGDDVGELIRFLCSDEAAIVNGQEIAVDGGAIPMVRAS